MTDATDAHAQATQQHVVTLPPLRGNRKNAQAAVEARADAMDALGDLIAYGTDPDSMFDGHPEAAKRWAADALEIFRAGGVDRGNAIDLVTYNARRAGGRIA